MANDAAQKSLWDRVTAIATILIPAAIALAGHLIAQGLKEAELASEERRAEQSRALMDANTKIAQGNLINTLMKSLTSDNPHERRLAVQAVLIALPDQGPVLARTIAQSDENKEVQASARQSIAQRVDTLIRDLFAPQASARVRAAQELVSGWRGDAAAAGAIVQYARANPGNENGIFNAIVVLSDFSGEALAPHKPAIRELAEAARKLGPKTEARVQVLLRRLDAIPG
ncbi:hypothetical protein [Massilia sp. ST3]|uniref:hypothetical protein n=1 Tax=Massilia sp. ST3 TaxID=2824903 RepID=UPI001B819562|nr:hypothetical protein [Massilia sp. ST3]MBQ5949080.1 hypothetical protein [Massilia sp. ST3]